MGRAEGNTGTSTPEDCRPACQRGTGQDGAGSGEDKRSIEGIAAPRVCWIGHKTSGPSGKSEQPSAITLGEPMAC